MIGAPGLVGGRSDYLAIITREATSRGVPPELADAVAMIETGYRADAVGSSGEIGLMQLLPSTAAQLGYQGSAFGLFDPATNIHFGVEYLARAWAATGGDICQTLNKYRAGLGSLTISPVSARYCARGLSWLASIGAHPAGVKQAGVRTKPIDPYVIAVVPALAALADERLHPLLATDHEYSTRYRHPATMAQRNAALTARFESHRRHLPPGYGDPPEKSSDPNPSDN
jgi:soluble lytic murein transglycosylase-like protein